MTRRARVAAPAAAQWVAGRLVAAPGATDVVEPVTGVPVVSLLAELDGPDAVDDAADLSVTASRELLRVLRACSGAQPAAGMDPERVRMWALELALGAFRRNIRAVVRDHGPRWLDAADVAAEADMTALEAVLSCDPDAPGVPAAYVAAAVRRRMADLALEHGSGVMVPEAWRRLSRIAAEALPERTGTDVETALTEAVLARGVPADRLTKSGLAAAISRHSEVLAVCAAPARFDQPAPDGELGTWTPPWAPAEPDAAAVSETADRASVLGVLADLSGAVHDDLDRAGAARARARLGAAHVHWAAFGPGLARRAA